MECFGSTQRAADGCVMTVGDSKGGGCSSALKSFCKRLGLEGSEEKEKKKFI